MRFSVIGTGNIAWYFSKKIAAAGHQCSGVFGRNPSAVKELADALLAPKSGDLACVNDDLGEVCFLAVSDTAIPELVGQLRLSKTVLVHMAGALPISVLQPAATDYGLLWPVYSILKQKMPRGRDIPCAWEASSERAKRFILEMGHAVTNELFEASEVQRSWLHLSAVISNNFINHLLALTSKLCYEHQISMEMLQPLIKQTFDRAKDHGAMDMQTGPAIRNDGITIEKHLEMLKSYPEMATVYSAITESIRTLHKS